MHALRASTLRLFPRHVAALCLAALCSGRLDATTPAQGGEPRPVDAALEAWRAGRRIEALELEEARLAAARGSKPAEWRRLAGWQLELHRPASALASAERCGADCAKERGIALFLLARYAECLPLLDRGEAQGALMAIDAREALGDFAGSDRELDEALARFGRGDARLLSAAGRRHARQENWTDACAAFRAALELDPCEAEALLGLARALLRSGAREEGLSAMARHRELRKKLDVLDHALEAVDLQPMHGPNWTAVGEAEFGLGRLERALGAFERAEGLCDESQLVPNALRHAKAARAAAGLDSALAVLRRARARSDDPRLVVRESDLLAEEGSVAEAARLLEELVARRPSDRAARERLEALRAKLRDARRQEREQ